MCSSYYRQWTPDVFVSFKHGEMELERLISTLFKKLKQAGIGYRHSHKDPHQEGTNSEEEINQARFALVVLSTNYANSEECLAELDKILLRGRNFKYPSLAVIPIIHGMKPTKGRESEKKEKKKKEKWRRALAKVEGFSGYEWKKDADGVELEPIVERLVNEIRSLYSQKVFGPFGGRGERSWHSDIINGIDVEYDGFIKSIKFDVQENIGTKVQHGKENGYRTYKVQLGEKKHIISFSGCFKKADNGDIRIKSLKFEINEGPSHHINGEVEETRQDKKEEGEKKEKKEKGKQNEEPEDEKGEPFSVRLPSGAGKVIEFFGSYGSKTGDEFLTSIGARVELLSPERFCPVGLFGSRRGRKWDDGDNHTSVKGIKVTRDSSGNRCIRSIAFLYDKVGENWVLHDGDAEPSEEFIINDPDEYLSSISGYYTSDGITSLTFLTNKKRTNTIGHEKGTHFSSPTAGCKIVGFYGWRDEHHLHGIGAYFKPIPDLKQIESFGPFGGGNAWDDGKFKGVKKIYITSSTNIDSIKFVYVDDSENDHTIMHPKGVCHSDIPTVSLHYPNEYLTSISGYTGDDGSIQALAFDSNIERYGPYGNQNGEYFWYPSNGTKIVGFYGTWGKTLNSIGVYAKAIPRGPPHKGRGGEKWDDGEYTDVRGYRVIAPGDKIESITFMYENNGSLVECSPHGGGDLSTGEWRMLDFPKERLLSIKGYLHKEGNDGQTIIHNLEIYTTKGADKPYADRNGRKKNNSGEFRIPKKSEKGRIVGFFGEAGTHLKSIEAHLEPS